MPMARVLVLADIHSNIIALDAVLQDAHERGGFDRVWVLGDIVGYGPEPTECIRRVRELGCVCVAGNHDLGVVGSVPLDAFNMDAALACRWTRDVLSASDIAWLGNLPFESVESMCYLVHGSPREPVWEYIMTVDQAEAVLKDVKMARHCLVGHTHQPALYAVCSRGKGHAQPVADGAVVALEKGRYLINPGSVGQPRDGDPRAAYAVYDSDANTVVFRRVSYDVGAVSAAILLRGLPRRLAARLHVGY